MTSSDTRNAANDIAGRVGQTAQDAQDAAKGLAAKAGTAANDFAARATDTASDVYGRAKDHLKDATDRLPDASEALDAGKRAYNRSSETVGRHVAKQPIEALLLAGAIGYLVGWASNRT